MICFVESSECIDDIIINLNKYLSSENTEILKKDNLIDYSYLFKSEHKRKGIKNINIYHIFLDYSKIYLKNN